MGRGLADAYRWRQRALGNRADSFDCEGGTRAALDRHMRYTKFPSIAIAELALVTGGKKGGGGYAYSYAWQQRQQAMQDDGGVDVSVATGQQGGQQIQQALQQG